jgi:predicted nucleic acid-binding protein
VVSRFHLDTDFLIVALTTAGPPRTRLRAILELGAELEMSALVWYEFERGPRTPEQLAIGRDLVQEGGILAFDEQRARDAARLFRRLTGTKRRSVDLAIAACALERGATLLTCNARDYEGIEGLVIAGGG